MCIYIKFCEILSLYSQDIERQWHSTSIKDQNSITNLQNKMRNNPNLNIADINVYIQFGEILSMCSQDIEWKRNSERNSDISQGPLS